jgi:tRNA A58 N-methylase Trm61
VISIEGRAERVNDAKKAFETLGISDRVDLNVGDMYRWLYDNSELKVDTVFCLGIFYHVMDHYMLLKHISNLSPK